jgi:hypothetical protein
MRRFVEARSADLLMLRVCVFGEKANQKTGAMHEPSAGVGGDEEGRVHFDGGWEARHLGGERAFLRGLGDLSHEGIGGESRSDLCFADERMVWADHSAVR